MAYLSNRNKSRLRSLLSHQQQIHFIGIGGIGMSALALILVKRNFVISGSDQKASDSLAKLANTGIKIFKQQEAENIKRICKTNKIKPLIIFSSAVPKNNPELLAAKKANLEILHRSDLLAELIKNQPSVAVAGSHGKTTTSTILTTLLARAKQDPTAVVGGVIPLYGSNAYAGLGKLLIAEADESDGTLVKLKAKLGIITNLDLDHTDHYPNIEKLIETMQIFSKNCEQVLANYDCTILRNNFHNSIWWSTETIKGINYAAIPTKMDGEGSYIDFYEHEKLVDQIFIPIPGLHNLSNTTAAIAACRLEGITFEEIKDAIPNIQRPSRRFDYRGSWNERHIVDDYAHHPSEIKATLEMSRLMLNSTQNPLPQIPKRLFVVFQPHRYSRTQQFLEEFALVLGKADSILLAPIYSAGEKPIQNINSQVLASLINKNSPEIPVIVANNLDEVTNLVKDHSQKNDLILIMGAGDINSLWERLQNPIQSGKSNIIQHAA